MYNSIMKRLVRDHAVSAKGLIEGWRDKYFTRICPDIGWCPIKIALLPHSFVANICTDRTSVGQHGRFHSPKIASVEAIHPIALDEGGELGYHVPGNVTCTRDSDNRRKWTWGVIMFLANKASRDATTLEELESVAARFDVMYINGQEVAVNKKARVGQKMSPERVDAIQHAFRFGTILKTRYVPESHLWKTSFTHPRMPSED